MIDIQRILQQREERLPDYILEAKQKCKYPRIWDGNKNICIDSVNSQQTTQLMPMPRPTTRPKVIQNPNTPGTNVAIKPNADESFIEKYKTPLIIGGLALTGFLIYKFR